MVATTALLVAPACGTSRDDGATATSERIATTEAPALAGTAWGEVLARIGPDGEVDKDTALQAFALAFGDVPGVEVPSGPVGQVVSGSEALRWAVRLRDQLSEPQKEAVDRILAATADAGEGGGGRSRPMRDGSGTSRYRAIVDEVLTRYKGPLGQLPIPTTVALVGAEGSAWALADGYDGQGDQYGAAARCAIGITPTGQKAGDDELTQVLAHEVFHCYQYAWIGLARVYHDEEVAPWVIEGSATWAGINVSPVEVTPEVNWWHTYLTTPSTALFSRSYDAVGFYGQIVQQGVDLWPLLSQFMAAQGNLARYHVLADAAGTGFLDAWAPGYFRRPQRGPAWDITGKAVPEAGSLDPPVDSLTVANGSETTVTAKPFTNTLDVLAASAEVTHLAITGHARLADEAGFDSTELADLYLCTRAGGDCACPEESGGDGSGGLPASRQSVTGVLVLGLTGGTDGAGGTVSGQSLDDFCSKKKARQATTSTLPPCQVITAEDASRLVPALVGATSEEMILNPNQSGICAYAVPGGTVAAMIDAQVYHRPQGTPVDQDYAMFAAICTEELAGIGQRAGIGGAEGGLYGCVLSNSTIVTIAAVGASRGSMIEELKVIAARL